MSSLISHTWFYFDYHFVESTIAIHLDRLPYLACPTLSRFTTPRECKTMQLYTLIILFCFTHREKATCFVWQLSSRSYSFARPTDIVFSRALKTSEPPMGRPSHSQVSWPQYRSLSCFRFCHRYYHRYYRGDPFCLIALA